MPRRTSISSLEGFPSDVNDQPEQEEEDKCLFVAVGEKIDENKKNLTWALQFFGEKSLVLVHVHCPDKYIPTMGAEFPISRASSEQVQVHRLVEQTSMYKNLDKYVHFCKKFEVKAEKLVIVMEDIAKGILELIVQHGITRLVMGAAADKHYSTNMRVPKSKTANIINSDAPASCKIWFVCKGAFIGSRETFRMSDAKGKAKSMSPSSSSKSPNLEPSKPKPTRSPSALSNPVQDFVKSMLRLRTNSNLASSFTSRTSSDNPDTWEGIPRNSPDTYPSSWSDGDIASNSGSSLQKDNDSHDDSMSAISYSIQSENQYALCPVQQESLDPHLSDNYGSDDEMYIKLKAALQETESFKLKAYEESRNRSQAEMEAMEAKQKVKHLGMQCALKIKENGALEELVARLTMENESLRIDRDGARQELTSAHEIISQLELQLDSHSSSAKNLECKLSSAQQLLSSIETEKSEAFEALKDACLHTSQLEMQLDAHLSSAKDLEERLSSAHQLLTSLQGERDALQQERDNAVKFAELNGRREMSTNVQPSANFLEFSFSELEKATQNFDDSLKIGEGGYGCVYQGFLRHTFVAIKILRSPNLQGISEFNQEVEILSKVRHPNLVTLIGACSEKWALIYEYLPKGSLEDHIPPLNNTTPLSWQARVRIAAEICCALIFLHSSKPQSVVHGDLKLANILLDANLTSKLGDFGISRLLTEYGSTSTNFCQTSPKGTLVYIDPEFLQNGELTTQSDVYSFGVVLLRLLTGKNPFGIVKEVKASMAKGTLQSILDATAGEWPYFQAQQLAELALRCCEMSRKMRPELVTEVWKVIAPMMNPLRKEAPSFAMGLNAEAESIVPPYFLCPIFQEIMRDPHVAYDGYTYELEAIRGWFENHKTSPMTNLQLPSDLLIPNLALRSAISEWLQNNHKS